MLIVTRHAGSIEWLRRRGITGKIVMHATPEMVRDQKVVGILPFHLASLAESLTMIDIPRIPKELRGVDLTPEQMDQYGASLKVYTVKEVENTLYNTKENNDVQEDTNRTDNRDLRRRQFTRG